MFGCCAVDPHGCGSCIVLACLAETAGWSWAFLEPFLAFLKAERISEFIILSIIELRLLM
jgi:hypothetical protein